MVRLNIFTDMLLLERSKKTNRSCITKDLREARVVLRNDKAIGSYHKTGQKKL
jgi:hypothetical protein